ncbi:sodium/proline symporter PutP [Brevibacillus borstelensis]|jgi:sodium/proline symporter|uniref:Sodium/proline symporter n=1 Tax=Brevibacillus borstelensis AK1 TaxID=1300222 RepID=M8DEZ2_9BACL|nr:sodium/proline symporter PutP [Brevibacillus borstelensis]EMT51987.1 sodium/proline symporter [Brevibacillus borstelensis AK1]MBE5394174.1 sodium/proline symporter PutP [Brevibacillus borstelensis]MCC0565547.1 sodium/proline symporter PutP [Brevibacillus borstelensis]MCM3559739.1 sodium/proline symporter PutP [Brevibacillus borstelensis]MED1742650.1 sodium/proline symporter PutP [Brevibacillus borstelensis]
MDLQLLSSIVVYMVGMLLIGYFAYKRTSNLTDYMLGGRTLGPAVTALSAGASDMSGWLMMGLPGAMFAQGISASWIAIGLTLGAYANWLYVAPRLRTYTEVANNSITIPAFLENRFGDASRILRLVSGLVIMIFFTFYVSSGLVSGGVLFENTFHLNYHTGLWIVAVVVIAYTLFGGFLAVSWTDFVQGLIMFIALILVPLVTIFHVGGIGPTFTEIHAINPALLDIFKGTSLLGIISLFAWGLGYFGQPHIIVRFMAISSVKEIKKARFIGMGWMIFSIVGAMFTGLVGIAFYSKKGLALTDPETVFIELGKILFHPLITGFLLAAILAAIMSTISSQLLVTSSSLTEDIYKTFFRREASDKELVFVGRLSVLVVSLVALLLAYSKNDTILDLVGYAWAGFGASFGPLILLSLYWKRMNKWGALAGMVAGAATVILWTQSDVLKDLLYEMIPGFAVSLVAIVVVSLLTQKPAKEIQEQFDSYQKFTK